jgi:hypothetical protein
MRETIDLVGLVQGDELRRAFYVQMKPTNDVFDTKQAILSEKPSFKGINAEALQLWKVREWFLHALTPKI